MVSVENRRPIGFRIPTPADSHVAREIVKDDGVDTNSLYYYRMWFRDFAHSSLVATVDEEVVGFLTGYRRPAQPDTYFAWQLATKPRHGIPDLELKIFDHATEQQIRAGAEFVEVTVAADDNLIAMVLKRFASARSARIEHQVLFPGSAFPDNHHDEVLYRIGPMTK